VQAGLGSPALARGGLRPIDLSLAEAPAAPGRTDGMGLATAKRYVGTGHNCVRTTGRYFPIQILYFRILLARFRWELIYWLL
jgi:hypothetical protein